MSVLSRAAAPPATHEVAAAVAALLKSFDPNAPSRLAIPETPESRGALDDPRLGESDAAEAHLPPKRLLGPMGLGSASLLVNLPTSGTIAGVADQAAHPVTPAGGVVPALRPTPPTPGVGQPLRPIPRANSSGRVPTPPTTPRAAPKSAGPGTPSGSGRIPRVQRTRSPVGRPAGSDIRRGGGGYPATAAAASPRPRLLSHLPLRHRPRSRALRRYLTPPTESARHRCGAHARPGKRFHRCTAHLRCGTIRSSARR